MSEPVQPADTRPRLPRTPNVEADSGPGTMLRSETQEPAIIGGRRVVVCPHCGHGLSRYTEPAQSRAEAVAARISRALGTWQFLLILALAIVMWVVVNVLARPYGPHPSAMLAYLGVSLTTLAVLQGPLILLTQHREADRDRAREIEILTVCQNAEADMHAIRVAIDEGRLGVPPRGADGEDRRTGRTS